MIKTMFVAAFMALVSVTQVSAQASMEDACMAAGELTMVVARERDAGIDPGQAYQVLIIMGLNPQLAQEMVTYVFFTASELTPSELTSNFLNECLGNNT